MAVLLLLSVVLALALGVEEVRSSLSFLCVPRNRSKSESTRGALVLLFPAPPFRLVLAVLDDEGEVAKVTWAKRSTGGAKEGAR